MRELNPDSIGRSAECLPSRHNDHEYIIFLQSGKGRERKFREVKGKGRNENSEAGEPSMRIKGKEFLKLASNIKYSEIKYS